MFLELNSKGLYQSSGKEKESCCLLFPSSTKREIRQFHVVVVQRQQRNVQKSVMHVQSCCFTCLNLLLFLPFSLPSLRKLPYCSTVVCVWWWEGTNLLPSPQYITVRCQRCDRFCFIHIPMRSQLETVLDF